MSVQVRISNDADDEDGDRLQRRIRKLWILVSIGFFFVVCALMFYFYQFHGSLAEKQESWGQFGDYLGGVLNPIFGFLSFIALLSTLALQSRELRLSTRELRNSAAALQAQNQTLRLQNFESAFFQLLRLHNDIVSSIDLQGRMESRGRDALRIFSQRLKQALKSHGALDDVGTMQGAYKEFFEQYQHELGHYFRVLYNAVKFVHKSDVSNKRFYTNLIRAQLSSDELVLLFFNCLTQWGSEKFKPLVEEYALLKTLPDGPYPSASLRAEYSPRAFGKVAPCD